MGILSVLQFDTVRAQTVDLLDSTRIEVDDIQIDLKQAQYHKESSTLQIDLFLTSLVRAPRELKLNCYATQVLDRKGGKHLFSSIQMGRVLVDIAQRQNYLNYLLEDEVPVLMSVKINDWDAKLGLPEKLLIVFEDSSEEGRYIETAVTIK